MAGNNSHTQKNELPGPQSIQCPSCSTTIKYFVPGQSIRIGCANCKNLFSLNNGQLSKATSYSTSITPIIPIGTVCTIKEANYKLVGFLYCKEYKYKYYWKEYIFFNPLYGYVTLNEYDGHWNLVVQTDYYPRHDARSVVVRQKEYQLFHKYRSQIVYAIGEFHWDLHETMYPFCVEYIHPPYALIEEKGKDEICWYHATYLTSDKVKEILTISNLPKKTGVASNQPHSFSFTKESYQKLRNLSIIILLITQVFFMSSSSGKLVLFQEYPFSVDTIGSTTTPPIISKSFEVDGGIFNSVNMEFDMFSPVDNDWAAAYITMVNEGTGEEYAFEHGVEYYHGYDRGNWSEGSQKDAKIISLIPSGKYHLNITPYRDLYNKKNSYFTLHVYEDVIVWTNFLAALACFLLIPLILHLRVQSFESKRWINSEFND